MAAKKHGNTGKRNAALDEEPLSIVHMRVPHAEKARWVKEAQSQQLKLSEYIRLKMKT